ncbi:hypothetical protein DPMN_030225 [Dreissena polymorpha]|uniref:Uncharacterized protein n=1 Tax=Dreissena polymorpha TaxID=45954 RepID=A0A9D4LZJ3_DREPO|nr:hypothetical protein DPMN_030225 [Dreissena polymorpha]
MQAGDYGFVFDEYEPNSEWVVIKFCWTIDKNSDETTIIITVRIKRKPMYFLLTIVLPVLFLAVMDLYTFVLPSDSGEVRYAVTVFLTFAVFLTIVSFTLSQSSGKNGNRRRLPSDSNWQQPYRRVIRRRTCPHQQLPRIQQGPLPSCCPEELL